MERAGEVLLERHTGELEYKERRLLAEGQTDQALEALEQRARKFASIFFITAACQVAVAVIMLLGDGEGPKFLPILHFAAGAAMVSVALANTRRLRRTADLVRDADRPA